MTTKRAAIYMRVSTQGQADNGMSLDFQEEKLLEYVKNNKYSLDKEKHIFIDAGVSGAKEDREGLKSLMKSAHRGEIDIVLVYKIDRFFRRILPLIEYVDILADYGVGFSSINQGDFNVDSVTGKIVLPIFGALAEMERDLIRERTMEGKRKKAHAGFYVGGGKPPFGYEFDKSPQGNKLKIVEDEKRVVNKIFELYAKEKKTLGEVARILERDGELTRDDKIMALGEQKSKKAVSGRWHPTVISRILKEERYIGIYYYGKTKKVTNRKTRKVEIVQSHPDHMITLSCDSILEDKSLFEKAQELLELNKRTKNTKTGYPLTGLMFCSHCGKNYVGYKHSKNKETYSYRCNGKMKYKKGDKEPKCTNGEVSGTYVLNEAWDKIYEIFKSPDNALKKFYNEKKSHSDIAKFQKQVQKLEELIKKHNGGIKDAIKLQIDAAAENRPIYDEVIDEKRVHIREAENGIRELEQKIESLKNLEYAKNNLYRLKEYYDEKIKTITDEKKIEIVQELVYRVLVNADGSITILYKFQEHDDEGDDGEWKKPQKGENTFQDELDNDAPFEAIKNFGQKVRAFTTTTHDDGSEYMLIECKTYGKEYEKELQNMQKSGGQLFTYFKFSNTADILMLYTSQYKNNSIEYIHNFVPIQEEYRKGDVANFYNMWNKQFESTGVLDSLPYQGQRESFTKKDLRELTDDESKKIFHSFASILRKHSVSDKPNAFNKIFNLFLAKLFDEAKRDTDQLEFCWKNNDHPVDFQVRLINLYKQGLYEFLKKEIAGIEDADFQYKTDEELREKKKKILKFNNVFAIKDVIDDESFDENQRVLREVVQLLEVYQIRYPRKQQHLSDFFERLLTTGLKQEVGQYFTPPPITKFIMRSLPLKQMITQQVNTQFPKLPAMIDYAAGSGHFITEALEEYQDVINSYKDSEMQDFFANAKKSLKSWQVDPYSWAAKYIYGIEKDYRLVKVAKVGCYFYGDGVAQVIHGDGLDSFKNSRSYTGLLSENTHLDDSTKGKFSFVLSNPPYSVSDCKDDLEYIGSQDDFTLYPYLSDKSRDIECLFIERTKHLLQDRGIAALVLPSSILHNTGIQTKTREIILRYFDIISIVELGSNTFMATGTNTVILFLRRRNNEESLKIQESIKGFFTDFQDVTLKGIVHPFSCYAQHVWDISLDEYIAVLQGNTSEKIKNHEIYKQYQKKIKSKNAQDFLEKFCTCEQEKILYFILTFSQKVVHIKSGEKQEEKNFLGYYFSDRRNHEGMHSMQSGKTIHEATQLYNVDDIDDETKASSYINKAFLGDFESPIHPSLTQYVARHRLVDMLTFDRADFEKTISLSIKKKVRYNEIWGTENIILLGELAKIEKGTSITSKDLKKGNIPVIAGGQRPAYYHSEYNREGDTITVSASGAYSGFVNYFQKPIFASDCNTIISKDERVISTRLIYIFLKSIQDILYSLQRGQAQPHVYGDDLSLIKIPLPPKDIQQKIVDEIGELEKIEKENSERIGELKESIESLFEESIYGESKIYSLSDSDIFELGIGKRLLKNEILEKGTIPVYSANVFEPFGFVNKNLLNDFSRPSVLWGIDGDWMVNGIGKDKEFYPTDHCGFLRVKEEKLSERFVAYFLNKEGKQYGFSRTKRASIDRIQNIKIPLPPLETQKKIVAEIEILEGEIEKLQAEIECIPEKKKEILKKYL